jgi:hypothetical protein
VVAIGFATAVVPALHMLVHVAEAAADARAAGSARVVPGRAAARLAAERPQRRVARAAGPAFIRGHEHAPGAPHHRHEGDQGPLDHGRAAPEHLGAALLPAHHTPVVPPPAPAALPPAPRAPALPLSAPQPRLHAARAPPASADSTVRS